jgi:GntR family transcriptional repressor for pyruvate dehydrogenase complex
MANLTTQLGKPVTKTTLSDNIADQIVQLISKGNLRPGDRLPPERELCKQFGVGRSSLREAVRCLAIVGLLDVRVGDGTFVAPDGAKFMGTVFEWRIVTEQQDITSLLELRLALEAETAYHTAMRGTAEDVAALRDIVEKMEDMVANRIKFSALDAQFHLTIARASQNKLMFDLLTLVRSQLERSLLKVLSLPGGGGDVAVKQHAAILEAIHRRDGEGAKDLMRAHIQYTLKNYKKHAQELI